MTPSSAFSIHSHQGVQVERPDKVLGHPAPKAGVKYDVDDDVDAVVEVEEDRADALQDEEARGALQVALEDEGEVPVVHVEEVVGH